MSSGSAVSARLDRNPPVLNIVNWFPSRRAGERLPRPPRWFPAHNIKDRHIDGRISTAHALQLTELELQLHFFAPAHELEAAALSWRPPAQR